jgi:hypothetical protein
MLRKKLLGSADDAHYAIAKFNVTFGNMYFINVKN